MTHAAQIPPAVEEYFGSNAKHPVIEQEFIPGRGWKTTGYNKRVTRSWVRKLRSEGVTAVALRSGSRLADFNVAEILKVDRRPLLGGRLI